MPQDSSSSPDPKPDPKQMRGIAKADVTRRIKRLESLIAEEDAHNTAASTDTLISSFRALVRWQDTCEPLGEDTYLDEIRAKYNQVVKAAKTFLRSSKEAAANASLRNLPPMELPTFDGQVSDYPLFISTFDDLVHKAPIDDTAKLARLLQFTKGKANHAIKSCVHTADGYARARSILKQRFSDSYIITQEILTNLRSGRSVSSPDGIRQLADDLSTAVATLHQMGTLSEMESQHFILDVLHRLPDSIQFRYKSLATEQKRAHQHYPSISDFATFVAREADDAADPVFGHIGVKGDDRRRHPTSHAAVAETTPSSPVTNSQGLRKCPLCSASHKLRFCSTFKRMSALDRLNFVRKNNMCYLCMSRGHCADDCMSSYVCNVDNCGLKHSKLLHVPLNVESNRQAAALSSSNRSAIAHIPFVQVKVSDAHFIAILDTASDATFCSKRLAKSLLLKGESTALSLKTLNGRHDSNATVVNLTAHSVNHSESLILTNVIVIDEVPLNNASPRVDFPHLRDLVFPNAQGADLLIGQDNADALVPLEVRKGKKGQPFAVRTLFGWSLHGPAHSISSSPITDRISHFISAARAPSDSLNEVYFQQPMLREPDEETTNDFHVTADVRDAVNRSCHADDCFQFSGSHADHRSSFPVLRWNIPSCNPFFSPLSAMARPLTRGMMLTFMCFFLVPLCLFAPMLVRGNILHFSDACELAGAHSPDAPVSPCADLLQLKSPLPWLLRFHSSPYLPMPCSYPVLSCYLLLGPWVPPRGGTASTHCCRRLHDPSPHFLHFLFSVPICELH